MENIVLTGLSGSGKTTLGRMAADVLGMLFVDMDDIIVEKAGMSINDIFAKYGERYFRDLEAAAAQKAATLSGTIIATGGGVVLREENMRVLRRSGRVIFLDRSPARIAEELDCGDRPLLAGGAQKLHELSAQRRSLYLSSADAVCANDGGQRQAVKELVALIREQSGKGGYAVIGDPIGHTLSPPIHNAVFAALGMPDKYAAIPVKRGELADFVDRLPALGIKGFNITIPHKPDIIPYLSRIEDEARLCGAVNTVVVEKDGLCGYNTDMQGLLMAVQDQGLTYRESKIAILGTGGAACGVALKAMREQAREVVILGRRPEAAAEIGARFAQVSATAVKSGDLSEQALAGALRRCDVLVNTIPLGMAGIAEDHTSLDFLKALPDNTLVCDLIYNPPRTSLLLEAESLSLKVLNGLPMLIYQAILADEHFTGKRLDRGALYKIAAAALAQRDKKAG